MSDQEREKKPCVGCGELTRWRIKSFAGSSESYITPDFVEVAACESCATIHAKIQQSCWNKASERKG